MLSGAVLLPVARIYTAATGLLDAEQCWRARLSCT